MVEPEDLYEPEWVEWFRLTPEERWTVGAQEARMKAKLTSADGRVAAP
jgi:hypothetical protein